MLTSKDALDRMMLWGFHTRGMCKIHFIKMKDGVCKKCEHIAQERKRTLNYGR